MDELKAPESYVAYPRASAGRLDTAARLQALSEGYYGLYYVALLNVFLSVPLFFWGDQSPFGGAAAWYACLIVIVGLASYPFAKKLGQGLSWSREQVFLSSAVVAISSLMCFGILGIMVYQRIAAQEMARLGVKRHWFGGIWKKEVDARIAELVEAPGPLPRTLNPIDSKGR